MLKCACVFDRKLLDAFFRQRKEEEKYDDISMYYGLFEDKSLIALTKMYPENKRVRVEKIKFLSEENNLYEEFLIKSAINFALTFKAKEMIITNYYKNYLLPMHFTEKGNEMIGEMNQIDFPHCCKKE